MLDYLTFYACLLLGALVSLRGFWGKVSSKYLCFYMQVIFTLGLNIAYYVLFFAKGSFEAGSASYEKFYWDTQLPIALISFGCITLEIVNHLLSPLVVTARFAQIIRRAILGSVFCFASIHFLTIFGVLGAGNSRVNEYTYLDFEVVESIILLTIIGAIFYYGIPIGRNMRGMILGYGINIATTVMCFAVLDHIHVSPDSVLYVLPSISYAVCLAIWLITLWDYRPNPAPAKDIQVLWDRYPVELHIKRMLGAVRAYVASVVHP